MQNLLPALFLRFGRYIKTKQHYWGQNSQNLHPKNGSRGCLLLHKSDLLMFKAVYVTLLTATDPQKHDAFIFLNTFINNEDMDILVLKSDVKPIPRK